MIELKWKVSRSIYGSHRQNDLRILWIIWNFAHKLQIKETTAQKQRIMRGRGLAKVLRSTLRKYEWKIWVKKILDLRNIRIFLIFSTRLLKKREIYKLPNFQTFKRGSFSRIFSKHILCIKGHFCLFYGWKIINPLGVGESKNYIPKTMSKFN